MGQNYKKDNEISAMLIFCLKVFLTETLSLKNEELEIQNQ